MLIRGKESMKVESGIQGFDEITGGGIPRSAAIALIGQAGAGKELLARHLAWNLLNQRSKVLYASITQAADELRHNMLSYGWDVTPFEENNQFRIVDVFTHALDKMTGDIEERKLMLSEDFDPNGDIASITYHKELYDLKILNNAGIKFFPLKSLVMNRSERRFAIFDTFSPILITNTKDVFQIIHSLKFATRLVKVTGIGIVHSGVHDDQTIATIRSLADAVIEVEKVEKGSGSAIKITKYPGKHRKGPFPIEESESGVNIIPIEMPDLM